MPLHAKCGRVHDPAARIPEAAELELASKAGRVMLSAKSRKNLVGIRTMREERDRTMT
jgi:hypothetical protein